MAAELLETLRARRGAVAEAWLARTLATYPERTARFLAGEPDRFHNPVGDAFRRVLPALVDELVGPLDSERLGPPLEELVRIRAVQGFTAAQAVAFVFFLRGAAREALGADGARAAEELAVLDARVDELALLAFEAFVRCRERIWEVKAGDARRRTSLLERMDEWRRHRGGVA